MDVLVVDIENVPINVLPMKRAVVKVLNQRVNVLVEDEGHVIRTPNFEMNMPLVIQVRNRFARAKRRRIPMTRRNLLTRDGYRCQYCGCSIQTEEYTADHVIPRCRGGLTTWVNIVVCCLECNGRKGSHLARDVGMRLIKPPIEPAPSDPRFSFRLHITKLHPSWQPWSTWLYWNVELEK